MMAKYGIWLLFAFPIIIGSLTCFSTVVARSPPENPPSLGGLTSPSPANNKIRKTIKEIEGSIKKRVCEVDKISCDDLVADVKAKKFRTHKLGGFLHFVSVKIDKKFYYHIRVQHRPGTSALLQGVRKKGAKDEIEYFKGDDEESSPASGSGSNESTGSRETESESENSSGGGTRDETPSGGLSDETDATPKVKKLVSTLRSTIVKRICVKPGRRGRGAHVCAEIGAILPLSFREQLVSGQMYYVRVILPSYRQYWHLKILEQSWTNTLRVVSVLGPKKRDDKIEYFE